ncbi:MAG: hypothetical protein IPM82_13545 [Saprospiraceae bacterium]|nr:hypothetical protein [Saprospiraceae bacterium]
MKYPALNLNIQHEKSLNDDHRSLFSFSFFRKVPRHNSDSRLGWYLASTLPKSRATTRQATTGLVCTAACGRSQC